MASRLLRRCVRAVSLVQRPGGGGSRVRASAPARGSLGVAILALVTPLTAKADSGVGPLWVENLSPLAGLVALPSMRTAEITRGLKVANNLAIASQFVVDRAGAEDVYFDGETSRATLALEYGWSADWSARISLPWVSHDAGFLDVAINRWHDFFGMPDGGRSRYPENQFSYRYQTNGHQIALNRAASGLGDVQFELNRVVYREPGQTVTFSLGYKAPTGDEDKLSGSGAGDVFAVLRFSGAHLSALPLTWHGQIGYTRAGDSELLGPAQQSNLWFAGLGVDWRLAEQWSLLAQYDAHAGILDSGVDAAGGTPAGMLSLGARWRPSSEWALELSFIEDIVVETAPDITFQATVRWRPAL